MESKKAEAERLKLEGNKEFNSQNYTRAISLYEKAISLYPANPIYYFNVAKAYSELQMWREAERDSNRALELDPKYIKAWLLNGKALVELGKHSSDTSAIDKGTSHIQKAIALCSGQHKREFENDATKSLRNARKIRWYKVHEILTNEGIGVATYLENLVNQEKLNEAEKAKRIKVMKKLVIPKKKRKADIPEYLLCDLTGELMENPVITSEGYTYEKDILMEFMTQNGAVDPVTKYKIDPLKIFPNINIKAATEEFLENHPWAYEYKGDTESYKDIKV